MILIDTGPIVALINDRGDRHNECRSLLERLPGPLLVPATVATEINTVVTLDRRNFSTVRPVHVEALTLLP